MRQKTLTPKSFWQNLWIAAREEGFFILGSGIILATWYIEKTGVQDQKGKIDEHNRIENFASLTSHEYKRAIFETNMTLLHQNSFRDSLGKFDTADYVHTVNLNIGAEVGTYIELLSEFESAASSREGKWIDPINKKKIAFGDSVNKVFARGNFQEINDLRFRVRAESMNAVNTLQDQSTERLKLEVQTHRSTVKWYLLSYILGTFFIIWDKIWKKISDKKKAQVSDIKEIKGKDQL